MKTIIICLFLLSNVLLAEEMQLNLPERFDAKIVKKKYYYANGKEEEKKISNDNKKQICSTLKFREGKFELLCKKENFYRYKRGNQKIITRYKWKGIYSKKGDMKGLFTL